MRVRRERLRRRHNLPPGRPGHARGIPHRVAFLASDKSSYATGGSYVADAYVADGGPTPMGAQLGSG